MRYRSARRGPCSHCRAINSNPSRFRQESEEPPNQNLPMVHRRIRRIAVRRRCLARVSSAGHRGGRRRRPHAGTRWRWLRCGRRPPSAGRGGLVGGGFGLAVGRHRLAGVIARRPPTLSPTAAGLGLSLNGFEKTPDKVSVDLCRVVGQSAQHFSDMSFRWSEGDIGHRCSSHWGVVKTKRAPGAQQPHAILIAAVSRLRVMALAARPQAPGTRVAGVLAERLAPFDLLRSGTRPTEESHEKASRAESE